MSELTELKDVLFKVELAYQDGDNEDGHRYVIVDKNGFWSTEHLRKDHAEAIAALPDALESLEKLERIKIAAEKTVRAINTNPIALFNEVDNLKAALEK